MDTDRPHHRSNSSNNSSSSSNSTSELFICFTSRLSSSSSMKISSKSILSPGRSREPTSQISLSNSLSRRLRTNGSMKGGQASPMFPTNNSGKKRGSFENPEPSSPKVTCIGQVRVKTKKQGRKMRSSRSQRRGGGEVSFRRVDQTNNSNNTGNNFQVSSSTHQDFSHTHQGNNQPECLPHRNQRWVHLPLTICEALRAFGAEFNCFLPCRSSCMASEKEKQEKAAAGGGGGGGGSSEGSSCGAVFARWLMAVQEGDDRKRREIELVVGEEVEEEEEEEEEEDFTERRRSYRRHVFEEIEFNEEKFGVGNESIQDEEAARVSICIPPKNALLLMRCRSDPVKMAALANKFWEAPAPNNENQEADDNDVNEEKEEEKKGSNIHNNVEVGDGDVELGKVKADEEMEQTEDLVEEKLVSCQAHESEVAFEDQDGKNYQDTATDTDGLETTADIDETNLLQQTELAQETLAGVSSSINEATEDPHKLKIEENEDNDNHMYEENENGYEDEEDNIEKISSVRLSVHQESEEAIQELKSAAEEEEEEEEEGEGEGEGEGQGLAIQESKEEKETTEEKTFSQEQGTVTTRERSESKHVEDPKTQVEETGTKSKERENQQPLLPDCLLLMMCEPKLSMEVSKETWVCSTDFIRWLPEHSRPPQVKKRDGGDQPKKRISIDNNPPSVQGNPPQQPPRSSCSYPAKPPSRAAGAESMTTAIERKLVGTTKAYEPFVLTRCKSEPMRSAAKLAPEPCFWKNRQLEPHRPATLGVGAAGVGF
ncbi:eukaryotic translation initiation factor 5B [Ricinus communis]|uniref:eukaryotic translation initiation factor 5B n=1 Tax=Ricinus communis TaxID=3988 RepID=UPI00201A758F|nr:eukaryotic translation initiation factor 5B [Ricinus communis]